MDNDEETPPPICGQEFGMKSAHDPAAQHKDPDLLLEHGSIASRPTSPIAQSISDEIQAGLGDLHSDLVAGLYAPRPLSQHRSQNVRKSTHQFEAIEESVEEHQHPVEWPEPIASRSWEESTLSRDQHDPTPLDFSVTRTPGVESFSRDRPDTLSAIDINHRDTFMGWLGGEANPNDRDTASLGISYWNAPRESEFDSELPRPDSPTQGEYFSEVVESDLPPPPPPKSHRRRSMRLDGMWTSSKGKGKQREEDGDSNRAPTPPPKSPWRAVRVYGSSPPSPRPEDSGFQGRYLDQDSLQGSPPVVYSIFAPNTARPIQDRTWPRETAVPDMGSSNRRLQTYIEEENDTDDLPPKETAEAYELRSTPVSSTRHPVGGSPTTPYASPQSPSTPGFHSENSLRTSRPTTRGAHLLSQNASKAAPAQAPSPKPGDPYNLISANKLLTGQVSRDQQAFHAAQEQDILAQLKMHSAGKYVANLRTSQFVNPETATTREAASIWSGPASQAGCASSLAPVDERVETQHMQFQTASSPVGNSDNIKRQFGSRAARINELAQAAKQTIMQDARLSREEKVRRMQEVDEETEERFMAAQRELAYDEEAIREALTTAPGYRGAEIVAVKRMSTTRRLGRALWKGVKFALAVPEDEELKSYPRRDGVVAGRAGPRGYGMVATPWGVGRSADVESGPRLKRMDPEREMGMESGARPVVTDGGSQRSGSSRRTTGVSNAGTGWPLNEYEDFTSGVMVRIS